MAEYFEKEVTCGDCIYADVCERVPILTEFSRDNIAYCKQFRNAADVVPVVHGQWRTADHRPNQWTTEAECSECNAVFEVSAFTLALNYNYCPNCGAKMGGE